MKVQLSLLFFYVISSSFAQNDTARVFSVGLEFRPRAEFRRGYALIPEPNDKPAFFISNRLRFNINYEQKRLKFHTSIQDIRIWGSTNNSFEGSTIGLFEGYVEPFFSKKWSVRIGRQAVELDNARLFARSDWDQTSRAHEGVNVRYFGKRVQSEWMGFYTQNGEAIFGNQFPKLENYLFLTMNSFNYSISDKLKLYALNAFDGFQGSIQPNSVYVRATSGGRLTYQTKKMAATVAGYYQYGQSPDGKRINSYYVQPEISFEHKRFKGRLGMEYMSGDHLTNHQNQTNSFNTLYGVSFRFMGNMNYFTRFPDHTHHAGLVDPYLFLQYAFSDQFSLQIDYHAFFAQQDFSTPQDISRFLGVEQDIKAKYQVNDDVKMTLSLCMLMPTEGMEIIQNRTIGALPVYAYYMLTISPELFKFSRKIEK